MMCCCCCVCVSAWAEKCYALSPIYMMVMMTYFLGMLCKHLRIILSGMNFKVSFNFAGFYQKSKTAEAAASGGVKPL